MATKHYNDQTFTFVINGQHVAMYAYTTRTRNGFCHHIETWAENEKYGEHTRVSYINRTWERFKYESVLQRAAEKFGKATRAALLNEIDAIARTESEKCQKWLQAFQANYQALSSEQKQFLQDHTPAIETKDQADTVAATVALMAAIA